MFSRAGQQFYFSVCSAIQRFTDGLSLKMVHIRIFFLPFINVYPKIKEVKWGLK